jgi:hypothetical protein
MLPTLLDIAKLNGTDAVVGLIEEATRAHPELTLGAARTIRGLNYKTKVRTGLPTVAFRAANEGTAVSKSAFENRLVECFMLNPIFEADKAVADSYEDGAAAYMAIEGGGILEAAMHLLAKQMYYGAGTDGDAKGYPGFIQAYDATNMVVDAGGTTATTGSSVWAVRWGPQHVQWVWGANGQLALSDVKEAILLDTNQNPYTGYWQDFLARPGVQVGSIYSIGRVKKLTEDASKGLTDALLATLLSKFPVGVVPDVFLMNRRSLFQLRSSRTATNPTGAPAPIPDESFNVPIAVTDAILNTEALTL